MLDRLKGRRPSPAMAVAMLALFISITGVGVAAIKLKANSVKAKQIAPGAVGTSEAADNKLSGTDIADGSVGTTDLAAAAVGARAYGRVSDTGVVTRSKNVASVSQAGTGVFCIALSAGIDPSAAVLLVSPDYANNATSTSTETASHVEWDSSGGSCAAGRLQVMTLRNNGDGTDNDNGGGDTLGDDLLFEDEPFSFVVP